MKHDEFIRINILSLIRGFLSINQKQNYKNLGTKQKISYQYEVYICVNSPIFLSNDQNQIHESLDLKWTSSYKCEAHN